MSRRRFSLSRLLGLGPDTPTPDPGPVEEFLDPYRAAGVDRAYLAGREYRRRYLEHTTDEAAVAVRTEAAVEGRVTPGSRQLAHNSQAGVAAWKGAVR